MDDLELTEIEILEKEIKRLKSDNQRLKEENQGQRSTVSELEKANGDLQQKNDSLQELKAAFDRLQADLDQKTEEAEQLFEDVQELEKINQEEMAELRRAMLDRAEILDEKEKWERKMEQVIEDNTVIILTLLTSQADLEEHLSRKTKILNTFSARALEIIKDARNKIERIPPTSINVGEEGSEFHEYDNETENVVNVMLWPLMKELNAIDDVFRGIR